MSVQHRPAGIYSVRSGDGIVFLDLGTDSYSCIYRQDHDEDATSPANRTAPAILCGTEDVPPSRRWQERDEDEPVACRLADIVLFLRALVSALATFPGRDVRTLLEKIHRSRPALRFDRPQMAALVARRFETLWLFLPFRGKCLFRSFVLLHYLRLYGLGADWIFGVSLFPFSAHCWLASNDLLIGERAHRIGQYEVIFSSNRSII